MKTATRSLLLPLAASFAASLAVAGCWHRKVDPAAELARTIPANTPAEWTRRATIYEVNTRQYTPEGTFRAFDAHLARLDSMGVDVLWFMPIQPIGVKNRKGGLGSPYSISDYRAVNREYGTAADFRQVVDDAHRLGMKVILDWVPNHTAFDHAWITQHPDWYVHRADGTISNARDNEGRETDWTDVAELNYDNADMRRAMIADMRYWMDSLGVDGFRCDVAGGVPMDFWVTARRELSAGHPGLFMLAEAEGPQYYSAFDMTYGWELHHLLNEIAEGKKAVAPTIDDYLARSERDYGRGAYRMYFTSNHDENSWNGTEFERMGENHVPAFVLAATLENGMPLVYTGQEASLDRRLRFFEKDTVSWSRPSLAAFYRSLLELKHAQEALANGAYGGPNVKLATTGSDRVYAFTRTRGNSSVLVAVNFGDASTPVSYRGLPRAGAWTDWVGGVQVTLNATGSIDVPAHGYRIFVK